ncbi:MAG TPA: response regulator transcription factor [Puia sp.]|jgi:DNA-binding response OmpR family regulator|nr:response regulator transcription factor [Puia sp.]
MKKYRLIVIDDQHDVLELLKYNLHSEGYEVKAFFNAVDALKYVTTDNTDLVITDWMLPEMDGLELCRNLKHNPATQDIPVVMLTARVNEIDVVTALEVGAEEYIAKPVRIREMQTRIKKILRRRTGELLAIESRSNEESITRGRLQLNLATYTVSIEDEPLDLTIVEFRLLELLACQPGKVFSRNQIMERINGVDYFAAERSVDVQIAGLRKKLGPFKDGIETVRSVGYRLNEKAL